VSRHKAIDYQLVRDSCKPLFTRSVHFLGNPGRIPKHKGQSFRAFFPGQNIFPQATFPPLIFHTKALGLAFFGCCGTIPVNTAPFPL
jgi:hypothetical protein